MNYFLQACPVCGRLLRVQVDCDRQAVQCSHCRGIFNASKTSKAGGRQDPRFFLQKRMERLLRGAGVTNLEKVPA